MKATKVEDFQDELKEGNEEKEEIQGNRDNQVLHYLVDVLGALKAHKPNDRSERDRYYQISITDLEKIVAFFSHFVVKVRDFQDPLEGQTADGIDEEEYLDKEAEDHYQDDIFPI